MKKKNIILFSLLFLLTGCSANPTQIDDNLTKNNTDTEDVGAKIHDNNTDDKYPLTITDFEGREYIIPKKPERVISLSPSITESVAFLDGVETIVGRTDYCDTPKEVLDVEVVGNMYMPNNEKIVSLEPDVILISAHTDPSVIDYFATLDIAAIRVYTSVTVEESFENTLFLGRLLDQEEKAEANVKQIKEVIENVKTVVDGLEKPTVYYCVDAGENGDFAATGDSFIHELIEIAGGINIAADAKDYMYSLEKLIEDDPELIIVSDKYGLKQKFEELEGYKDLSAVVNGNIIEIDDNPIDRACTSLDVGIKSLAKTIHPDSFK